MSAPPDELAHEAIVAALKGAPNGQAVCTALMRLAGGDLADVVKIVVYITGRGSRCRR